MFNLPDEKDFNYMLKELGTPVLINDEEQTAIISNLDVYSNDTRKLTTLFPVQTGDWVKYNDSDWLVMTDGEKRYNKYCVLIKKSSYRIAFPTGVTGEYILLPVIIQQKKNARNDQGYFVFPDDEIIVTVRESEQSSQIKTDDKFIKWGVGWKVLSIDRAQKGLINLYCGTRLLEPGEKEPGSVNSIVITPSTVSITVSETQQLTAAVYDINNYKLVNEGVLWTSSDTSIATVDSSGLVSSVAEGSCTITATSESNSAVAGTCVVTVVPGAAIIGSVVVTPSSVEIYKGDTYQLTAKVYDTDNNELTDETVTWASSNTSVATVDSTGKVTSVAIGNCTITATSVTDTSKSDTCAVTIADGGWW
jgi:uncharacterized protein YjdB